MRCEAALQRGMVGAGVQGGIDPPAWRAPIQAQASFQRHAGEQAVAQDELGVATQREQAGLDLACRRWRRGGLQIGFPGAGQPVRAPPPRAVGRAGEPQRRFDAGKLARAANAPAAVAAALGGQRGLCTRRAVARVEFLQVDAPRRATAFGLHLRADLHRQCAARVEPTLDRESGLQPLRRRGPARAVGRGESAELHRCRAAERHRRGARIEQRRPHAVQAQRQFGGVAMPMATAFDATGALNQLHGQALHVEALALARMAAELQFECGERQTLLIPTAG
jgi:hypothetical protein